MTTSALAHPKTIDDLGQELTKYRNALPSSAKRRVRIQRRGNVISLTVGRTSGLRVSVDSNVAALEGNKLPHLACQIDSFRTRTEASPELTRVTFLANLSNASSARDQFSARVTHFFKTKVASQLHEAALKDALDAPNELTTILNALERPEVAASVREQDPLAIARLRGIEARRRLLSEEGGMLRAERVGRLLTMSRQAVDKRRKSGRLIGVPLGRRGYGYPAWQFSERGTLPYLETILDALQGRDAWSKVAFFMSENAAFAGRRPLDVLRSGEVDTALAAARTYGEQGAL